ECEKSYKEDTTINQTTLKGAQMILSDNVEIDISEKNYENTFTIDQVTFKNILNDSDKMDTFKENYEDAFSINQVILKNA
ncbi:23562_t:CDS:1, partial [Gigaspora rosea]